MILQRSVDCPLKLKKVILKNLKKTAKDRIFPGRAQKAQVILAAIKRKPKVTTSAA
jgi:hypothetical protein